ncbi:hypothetical protein MPER_07270, partial [Moniliophthora perniciosa FA553]
MATHIAVFRISVGLTIRLLDGGLTQTSNTLNYINIRTNEEDYEIFADDPEDIVDDAPSVHIDFGTPSSELPDDLDIAPSISSPTPFSIDSQDPSVPETLDVHPSPSACFTEDSSIDAAPDNKSSSVVEPLSRPPSPPPSLYESSTDSEESQCSTPDTSDFDSSDSYSEAMDLDTEYSEEQSSDMDSDGYESS